MIGQGRSLGDEGGDSFPHAPDTHLSLLAIHWANMYGAHLMWPSGSQRVGMPRHMQSLSKHWTFTMCLALFEHRDRALSKTHTPALTEFIEHEPSTEGSKDQAQ